MKRCNLVAEYTNIKYEQSRRIYGMDGMYPTITTRASGGHEVKIMDNRPISVKTIETSLNQNEIQSLSDYLYAQLLQICAMPSREAQSGSTTGQSSMLSGGWQEAEEDAYRLEEMFDEGEKKFLAIVKNILDRSNTVVKEEVKLRDIDIKFSRNKVTNMLVKTQGLLNMKTFGIHPRVAIQTADLFSDPQQVYVDSREYLDAAYNTELNTTPNCKQKLEIRR